MIVECVMHRFVMLAVMTIALRHFLTIHYQVHQSSVKKFIYNRNFNGLKIRMHISNHK